MLESASLLSFYLAFALLHAADARRFPLPWVHTRALFPAMKIGAAGMTLAGIALWAQVDGRGTALLVAVTALSAVAMTFVLLAPIAARFLWLMALACPPLIAALTLRGLAP